MKNLTILRQQESTDVEWVLCCLESGWGAKRPVQCLNLGIFKAHH